MRGLKGAFAAVMFAVVLAFVLLAPIFLQKALPRNQYTEWMQPSPEPYSGIVRVWHIVGFKPYKGSFGNYLAQWSRKIEKKHVGIYFEVLSMTAEEAAGRLSRGESPDIYSFPAGYTDSEGLLELDLETPRYVGNLNDVGRDKGLYAVPYAVSGYCLLANSQILQERNQVLPAAVDSEWLSGAQQSMTFERGKKRVKISGLAGDAVMAAYWGLDAPVAPYEDFLNKRAALAIADARAAGDLQRSLENNKGFTYEIRILDGFTTLVQLLGINKSTEPQKVPYALEFIQLMLSEEAQATLADIGAFPATALAAAPKYDLEVLQSIAKMLEAPVAPNAFLYKRYRDTLYEAANRALSGDAFGAKEFEERLIELEPDIKIR
ncbi:MAG: hypothetical protein AAGU74_12615 [Bacillota bacterium]